MQFLTFFRYAVTLLNEADDLYSGNLTMALVCSVLFGVHNPKLGYGILRATQRFGGKSELSLLGSRLFHHRPHILT